MKIDRMWPLLAAAFFALGRAVAQTAPGDAPPLHILKGSTGSTGSIIRKQIEWSTKIPLNKTYAELTPEQKADFHAMYESISPGDEPPFPLEGLKPIVSAILKGQNQRGARGDLRMVVTVNSQGKGQKVEDYGELNDPEMVKFAASVLLVTKYKPARCAGVPCTMQFPFNLKLKREDL